MSSRPFAEATQAEIDAEVSRLLREAEERAVTLLKAHRSVLDSLVTELLDVETVDGSEVYRLAGQPDRSTQIPPVPPAVSTTVAPPRAAAATSGPLDGDRHDSN
jgi:cell division protease FtsH